MPISRQPHAFQKFLLNLRYQVVSIGVVLVISASLGLPGTATAQDTPEDTPKYQTDELPWAKHSISLGYFFANLSSSIRLGAGLGVDIDLEDALNLEARQSVWRLDATWRFKRKHRLDLGWFAFHRTATRTIGQDITIEDKETGEEIVIEAGTKVNSLLDLDLFKLGYSYSFFLDDRLDLAAGIGLYIAPLDAGISSQGAVETEGRQNFTAPLPTFTLRLDVAVTPKWFLRFQTQVFYLEYENFAGSVWDNYANLEYKPWKHFGIGAGYNTFRLDISADGEDYPNIDFRGDIGFQYAGLLVYAKAYF